MKWSRLKQVTLKTGRAFSVCVILTIFVPATASADGLLDSLRNFDLNNYALGVHVSVSQNPYTNAKNSVIVFPYLTSFVHRAFTKDWLLISDGDLGVRKVMDSGWVVGALGRIQTLGLGSEKPDELQGLHEKQWAIEVAPLVGYRGWPVHFTGKVYKEISGRHGGWVGELILEYPLQRSWGYVVPTIKVSRLDDTYSNYYFEVTPEEETAERTTYAPGAATNVALQLIWGYQISEKWLLSGKFSYQKLDDAITDSPIVDKDSLWSGGIGIAYNADIFRPREFGADTYQMPRYEFRAGVFQDNISTKIVLEPEDGSPAEEVDLEDRLKASDTESVLQLDALVRFNSFHRIEFGYFDFSRESSLTLQNDIDFGDETFPAGTIVDLRTDLRVARVSYAFSLIHDAQKELGVMAGVHHSRVNTEVSAPDTDQRERSTATTPLPVIGAHGRVSLGARTFMGARVQIFRMQFDQYEGSLNYINFEFQHMFGDTVSAGVGYNFYDLKLDSDHSAFDGRLEVRHHGPFLFLGAHF